MNSDTQRLEYNKHNQYYKMDEDDYILLNPTTGAIDVVDGELIQLLEDIKNGKEISDLDNSIKEIIETLKSRGYIINSDNFNLQKDRLVKLNKLYSAPHFLFIFSYNCNFRCPYCFEALQKRPKEFLSTKMTIEQVEHAFKTIDETIEEYKKKTNVDVKPSITLFGGEPLLLGNKKLVEKVIEETNKREGTISAITNGYTFDQYIPILKKAKLGTFQITIDGPKEIHDQRRYLAGHHPTFDKLIDNIQLATDNDISITMRINLNPENMHHLTEIIKLYESKGWNDPNRKIELNFGNVVVDKCARGEVSTYTRLEHYRELHKYLGNSELFQHAINRYLYPFIPSLDEKEPSLPNFYFCGANTKQMIFDPFNAIYPCWGVVGIKEHQIGSYGKDGFVIFEENSKKWRRSVFDNVNCGECSYSYMCGGGCIHHTIQDERNPSHGGQCDQFPEIFREFVPKIIIEGLKDKSSIWYRVLNGD